MLSIIISLLAAVALDSPELVWSCDAQSTLYAAPLVADIHPAPGLETVISDSEARRVVCVSAQGEGLWVFEAGWTKRLTSGPALSTTARTDGPTLAIAGSDGLLVTLDAATGDELWRKELAPVTWGGVVWGDLDGDLRDELIVGTDNDGVHAFTATGDFLWQYPAAGSGDSLLLRGGLAVADVEWNGIPEVFGIDHYGPFCLYGNGKKKWHRVLGMDFVSAPVIADADDNGKPELYATSRDTNGVYCFDADNGEVLWRVNMVGGAETYGGGSIAVGDLDGDGHWEIITADDKGHVYCLTDSGDVRWVFPTRKQTHAAPSLGDVDGDGMVEVLVASGDHNLYCLSSDGHAEWIYEAGLRLINPATIADVDLDGDTDILFGGSDTTLRCISLRGEYNPALMPWPMHRHDPARTASSHGAETKVAWVEEEIELLPNGGFELEQQPQGNENTPEIEMYRAYWPNGWNIEDFAGGTWRLDTLTKFDGDYALKVFPRAEPITVTSDWLPLEPGLATVEASVIIQGGHLVHLRWFGLDGLLREDPLKPFGARSVGDEVTWYQFALDDIAPPPGARWLAMAMTSEPKGGPTWWDEATILAQYRRLSAVDVLVNQVGYDIGAPKRFVVQSNIAEADATFQLLNASGNVAHEGVLTYAGRIIGAYDSDWGHEYYTGDFSGFDTEGDYTIAVHMNDTTGRSPSFTIANDHLWNTTARLAHEFFYYQRCGAAVPGFHEACHLDDAASEDGERQFTLHGGWHDAGDYNTYSNAPYVMGLARAYTVAQSRFDTDDRDANGRADFLDEILWGGEHSRRMIAPDGSRYGDITSGYEYWGPPELETDNIPGTGDERRLRGAETGNDSTQNTAAMARIARFVDEKEPWVEPAKRGLAWADKNNARGPLQFSAAMDLYAATGDEAYAALAKSLVPDASSETADLLEQYDTLFDTDHKETLRAAVTAEADAMIAAAENPFGLYPYSTGHFINYFGTPIEGGGWHVGNSSHVLRAAHIAAIAYRYTGDTRYQRFAYDQLNWVLGMNPFGVCLMEGAGTTNLPSYHHRYAFAGVPRGAVPGGIANGVTWRGGSDDRPYLDLRGIDIPDFEPNEVWLPHNTAYLAALAQLYAPVND